MDVIVIIVTARPLWKKKNANFFFFFLATKRMKEKKKENPRTASLFGGFNPGGGITRSYSCYYAGRTGPATLSIADCGRELTHSTDKKSCSYIIFAIYLEEKEFKNGRQQLYGIPKKVVQYLKLTEKSKNVVFLLIIVIYVNES